MLLRRHTLHAQLVLAFAGVVTMLLFVALVLTLTWLFAFERATAKESLQIQASMVAARSVRELVGGNHTGLSENLAMLSQAGSVRWAMILRSDVEVARYGQVPADFQDLRKLLAQEGDVLERTHRIIVRRSLRDAGNTVSELLVGADLSALNIHFISTALIGALLLLGMLLVALPIFHRLVLTVSDPLAHLTRLSQMMSSLGNDSDSEAIAKVGAGGTALGAVDAPVEVGRLGASFNRMLESIAARDQAMQRSRDELRELNASLQAVREAERTRIAHEIHDELGQRLTAIKLEVARLIPPSDAEGVRVSAMLDETVKVVREISWELRPSVLDTLGLVAAIEWLGEDFQRRMATRCRIELPNPAPEVDAEVSTHLFRICQELLTNIARHASASRVDIRLGVMGSALSLEVSDNGVGMKAQGVEQKSLGLLGIRERVHSLAGKLTIVTVPEIAGTRVSVSVPWSVNTGAQLGAST